MPAWGLVALGALALLLLAGGIWGVVKAWGGQKAQGAITKDDLEEAEAGVKILSRIEEVKREHPKTARALADALKRRLERVQKSDHGPS